MAFLPVKYATAVTIPFIMVKRAVVDLAVAADWTPATGDVKISIDGGNDANIGTLPSAPASTAGLWTVPLTTGETTGKLISIRLVDSATKAVEDNALHLFTYGHASAYWPFDLSTALSGQAVGSVTGAVGSVTGNVGGNVAGSVASVTTVSDKTGYRLSNPAGFKTNTAVSNFTFPMYDVTTGALREGLTVTAQRRIDSGAVAACANAVTEVSDGLYTIDLAASDLNGDFITLLFEAVSAKPLVIPIATEP